MATMLGTADLDLLTALFEGQGDCPFFMKDAALRYRAANGAMAELCGVATPAALLGQTATDVFGPVRGARFEALDRRILEGGRAITNQVDLDVSRAGRGTAALMFARLPVRDGEGRTVGVAATARRLDSDGRTSPGRARAAAVAEALRRGFAQPLDLPRLALEQGVSPSQLERDFRALYGMPLTAWLHDQRMTEAMRRLEGGEGDVASVAYACGYADQSAFARRFRRAVGMTPGQFRKLARRPLAAPSSIV